MNGTPVLARMRDAAGDGVYGWSLSLPLLVVWLESSLLPIVFVGGCGLVLLKEVWEKAVL